MVPVPQKYRRYRYQESTAVLVPRDFSTAVLPTYGFERYATVAGWEKETWATQLSPLLSGRALEVYSRLLQDEAMDYERLKLALLKRYDFTGFGYRRRFCDAKSDGQESSGQFIIRLKSYLTKWVKLAKVEDRGGVEEKRLEAKAKDSLSEDRHSRGQGQKCLRPRPRIKDTSASALQKKKKKGLHKNFSSDLHKKTFSKKFFKRSTKF